MMRTAPSMSAALRSFSLTSAISRTWSRLMVATFSARALPLPFSIPAACLSSSDAGGLFVMKLNERSSKTVSSTGMTVPICEAVRSLYSLTKPMMFTPC